jgi:hypothetical protein
MAYLRGVRFTEISVVEDEDSLGHVTTHGFPDWFHPDIEVNARHQHLIERRVQVLLAGGETQAAWADLILDAPLDIHQVTITGASHDLRAAMNLADHVAPVIPTLEAYIEWLRQEVLDVVGRGIGHDPGEYMSPVSDVIRQRIQYGDERFWAMVGALTEAVLKSKTLTWTQARKIMHDADPLRQMISGPAA